MTSSESEHLLGVVEPEHDCARDGHELHAVNDALGIIFLFCSECSERWVREEP